MMKTNLLLDYRTPPCSDLAPSLIATITAIHAAVIKCGGRGHRALRSLSVEEIERELCSLLSAFLEEAPDSRLVSIRKVFPQLSEPGASRAFSIIDNTMDPADLNDLWAIALAVASNHPNFTSSVRPFVLDEARRLKSSEIASAVRRHLMNFGDELDGWHSAAVLGARLFRKKDRKDCFVVPMRLLSGPATGKVVLGRIPSGILADRFLSAIGRDPDKVDLADFPRIYGNQIEVHINPQRMSDSQSHFRYHVKSFRSATKG